MAERFYATGRRKESTARVWVTPGGSGVTVNGKPHAKYLVREALQAHMLAPMNTTGVKVGIMSTVKGGGLSGQAGALRHGIARALLAYDPELRGSLREGGFLTRDTRVVERKKYGRPKARRSFQFSKR